jgi:hypothetical protein
MSESAFVAVVDELTETQRFLVRKYLLRYMSKKLLQECITSNSTISDLEKKTLLTEISIRWKLNGNTVVEGKTLSEWQSKAGVSILTPLDRQKVYKIANKLNLSTAANVALGLTAVAAGGAAGYLVGKKRERERSSTNPPSNPILKSNEKDSEHSKELQENLKKKERHIEDLTKELKEHLIEKKEGPIENLKKELKELKDELKNSKDKVNAVKNKVAKYYKFINSNNLIKEDESKKTISYKVFKQGGYIDTILDNYLKQKRTFDNKLLEDEQLNGIEKKVRENVLTTLTTEQDKLYRKLKDSKLSDTINLHNRWNDLKGFLDTEIGIIPTLGKVVISLSEQLEKQKIAQREQFEILKKKYTQQFDLEKLEHVEQNLKTKKQNQTEMSTREEKNNKFIQDLKSNTDDSNVNELSQCWEKNKLLEKEKQIQNSFLESNYGSYIASEILVKENKKKETLDKKFTAWKAFKNRIVEFLKKQSISSTVFSVIGDYETNEDQILNLLKEIDKEYKKQITEKTALNNTLKELESRWAIVNQIIFRILNGSYNLNLQHDPTPDETVKCLNDLEIYDTKRNYEFKNLLNAYNLIGPTLNNVLKKSPNKIFLPNETFPDTRTETVVEKLSTIILPRINDNLSDLFLIDGLVNNDNKTKTVYNKIEKLVDSENEYKRQLIEIGNGLEISGEGKLTRIQTEIKKIKDVITKLVIMIVQELPPKAPKKNEAIEKEVSAVGPVSAKIEIAHTILMGKITTIIENFEILNTSILNKRTETNTCEQKKSELNETLTLLKIELKKCLTSQQNIQHERRIFNHFKKRARKPNDTYTTDYHEPQYTKLPEFKNTRKEDTLTAFGENLGNFKLTINNAIRIYNQSVNNNLSAISRGKLLEFMSDIKGAENFYESGEDNLERAKAYTERLTKASTELYNLVN